MDEPAPMWIVFPDLGAEEVHNQGAVDGYIEYIWLPFWQTLSEDEKAAYLDKYRATPDWRDNIAERYEWEGYDADGDPIPKNPFWARRPD